MKKPPRKPAVSTKRPAIALAEEPVPNRKRTSKKKSGSSSSPLEIVVVAQEAVPLQMVGPSTGVPTAEETVEQPAAEEDISADQPVDKVTGVVGVEEVAAEIDASADRDKPADTTEERQWFDLSHEELIAKWAAERLVTTPVDTDEGIEAERPVFASVKAVAPVVEVCKCEALCTEERQWFDLSHEELIAKWAAERLVTTPVDTDEGIEAERPVFASVKAVAPVVEVSFTTLAPSIQLSLLPVVMHTYKTQQQPDNSGENISQYNSTAAGYAKITQNDDASTNLDDAVLDMPHRYQLLVNQQASILHNDSKPAVAPDQTTSRCLQQPAVAQRKLLLLDSTCKTVLATRHSLVDHFNCACQPPAATISNTTQLPKLVVNTKKC
ncbi:hypothetical protein F511_43688 [Dorcoceras hygrometricum]|uniref:Uncharacterized protein n=1 Tax=Dorcoceras hygrometricum TaxID=472368 RepID=A0A2Z6ZZ55_9LAMI|nr:hypothetical protein F511_43688 [Dorcoceras hygrometricum]